MAVLAMLLPIAASADTFNPGNTNIWDLNIVRGPLVLCHGNTVILGSVDKFGVPTISAEKDTCRDICNLIETIVHLIYFGMGVILWIVAPILFGVGGFMLLIAGASPEMITKGKKTLSGTVIGVIILISSWLILNTFIYFVGITGIGGFGEDSCKLGTEGNGQAAFQSSAIPYVAVLSEKVSA